LVLIYRSIETIKKYSELNSALHFVEVQDLHAEYTASIIE